MTPEPTVGGTLSWGLWLLGEFAFKWVPGAVVSITTSNPGMTPPTSIIAPVSATQAVDYLQTASAPGVYDTLFQEWSSFVVVSMLLTLGFSALIIYCSVRMFQIRQLERRQFASLQQTITAQDVPKTRLRWEHILDEANSGSEKSWRLAVLEADIMLNELLDSLGYKGETMADKMRSVERGDFKSIDLAWEAHRFRNRIAHEAGIMLSQREVRRAIDLYERVFREFQFIE